MRPLGGWEYLVEPATPHLHDTEGWVVYVSPNPVLVLVPDGGRWAAATSHTGAKVDLCRGVSRGPDHVEFVDVEVDVVWRWGEPARVLDMDEFEALRLVDADAYLAEAERIRACADAGRAPFGPAFRQRLGEVAAPGDPRLAATWASGVGPLLAGDVLALVGPQWLDRQRAGEGWLLCGGHDEVTAVAWVDGDGADELVAGAGTPMGRWLLDTAPALRGLPAPATARW